MMEFTLRPWAYTDVDSVTRYANNPKIAENLRNAFPFPYTAADAEAFIKDSITRESRTLSRAIVVAREAVGSIGVFPLNDVYEKTAEIGYWLAEPFWGNGIMPRAVSMICEEAFSRFGLTRIHAEIFAQNTPSCRVLEKAGFAFEGTLRKSVFKNGIVMDAKVYALVR